MGLVAWVLGWPGMAAAEFFVPETLGGSVGYGYGYTRSENIEMERTTLNLQLSGTGYFWEPWFVTMGAGLGVGLSETVTNPGGGGNATGVSGSLDFTVFPLSRFPTQFGYSITNSQTEVSGNSLAPSMENESRRFYIRQQYTSPGKFRLLAHYNRIESISQSAGDSVTNSFGLDVSKRQSFQTFHGGVSYSEITMEQPSRTGSDSNLFFNHSYLPGPDLGVISLIGYAMNEFEQGGSTSNESASTQGSSSFYWRPQDRPFYISGGLRAVKLETAAGEETRSAGTNINASYNYSRNTRFLIGASANATDSGDGQTTSVSETFSASYSSDPHRLLRMDYAWNAGMGFGNTDRSQEGGSGTTTTTDPQQEDSVQSGSLNLGHRLHKTWLLTKFNSMGFNIGQSGGVSTSSNLDEPTYSVNHGASLNWNRSVPGAQTHAAAQYSDTRTIGIITTIFKSWTFQLSRQQTINRLSGINGSFNYQHTATESEDTTDPALTVTSSGESGAGSAALGYNHSRFLGIYRLHFRSSLTTRDLLRSSSEETTAYTDEIKLDWRNNFTYNIGLLSMTLNINMTDAGGDERVWSAFFRATRSF